ncbi:MAG TPA: hypothetical protein VM287_08395 [Egibacteraceae bacterium]|nr:hypothetical protein [Egibacteraceae bacterium]
MTFEDAETALGATADLSQDQVAGSLEAVEQALPTLIEVGALMDRTLSALNVVPFAPEYRPVEPFDDSLRSLQRAMEGLPDDLREQAALIGDGRESLGDVREGTVAIADDLGDLHAQLSSALHLLRDYATTAGEAGDLMGDSDVRLSRQLAAARILVVVLGASLLVGQLVPLGIGWLLLHPHAATAFLADAQRSRDRRTSGAQPNAASRTRPASATSAAPILGSGASPG